MKIEFELDVNGAKRLRSFLNTIALNIRVLNHSRENQNVARFVARRVHSAIARALVSERNSLTPLSIPASVETEHPLRESQTKRSSRFILHQALANGLNSSDLRAIANDMDTLEAHIKSLAFPGDFGEFRKRYIAAILDEPEV